MNLSSVLNALQDIATTSETLERRVENNFRLNNYNSIISDNANLLSYLNNFKNKIMNYERGMSNSLEIILKDYCLLLKKWIDAWEKFIRTLSSNDKLYAVRHSNQYEINNSSPEYFKDEYVKYRITNEIKKEFNNLKTLDKLVYNKSKYWYSNLH